MTFTCTRPFLSPNGTWYAKGDKLTLHQYNEIPFSDRDFYFRGDEAVSAVRLYKKEDADDGDPEYRDDFYK